MQSLPILKSTHECTQSLSKSEGHIIETICKETHLLRPFSKEGSGATTETEFTLVYQRKTSGTQTKPSKYISIDSQLGETMTAVTDNI